MTLRHLLALLLCLGLVACDGGEAHPDAASVVHPKPSAAQDALFRRHRPEFRVSLQGRDGWVFLGNRYSANVAQALGRFYYTPEQVRETIAALAHQRRWLERRGIASLYVVVPAKWNIYDDKLPAWTESFRLQTVYQQLLAAGPREFVDVRRPLRDGRKRADTFSRLNSHWTQYGGYLGYREIVRRLKASRNGFDDVAVPSIDRIETIDAANEFEAIDGHPGPNNWTVPEFTTKLPGYVIVNADGSRTDVAGDVTQFFVDPGPVRTESKAPNDHRLLVLADSTAVSMSNLLAQEFGTVLFVKHRHEDPNAHVDVSALVRQFKPDVVLTLITERNLHRPYSLK